MESADGGFCDDRYAEVVGKAHNYIFSSLGCDHDEKTDFASFEKVISTLKIIDTSNQSDISSSDFLTLASENTKFDACGEIGKYKNEAWYQDVANKLKENKQPLNGVLDVCQSLDKNLVIILAMVEVKMA